MHDSRFVDHTQTIHILNKLGTLSQQFRNKAIECTSEEVNEMTYKLPINPLKCLWSSLLLFLQDINLKTFGLVVVLSIVLLDYIYEHKVTPLHQEGERGVNFFFSGDKTKKRPKRQDFTLPPLYYPHVLWNNKPRASSLGSNQPSQRRHQNLHQRDLGPTALQISSVFRN